MSSPLREQYLEIKRRHPGLILLFQIGDFYETFDEDARIVARDLGVVLTRKWFGKDDVHPLAGVPVRSLEGHLAKLIQLGHRIAICDQVTPPGKGLVERAVVRIITPGTVMEPGLLQGRESNYLGCLLLRGRRAGLAYADVSTGEFRVTEHDLPHVLAELSRLSPAELLVARGLDLSALEPTALSSPRLGAVTELSPEQADLAAARQALLGHFGVVSLHAYGCDERPLAAGAAGALLLYLRDTQPDALANLHHLQSYQPDQFMQLDAHTLADLEVFSLWRGSGGAPIARAPSGAGAATDSARPSSLVTAIDLTVTTLGGRLLRRWLRQPLLDLPGLRARHDAIEWFLARAPLRKRLRQELTGVLDIERTLGRIRRRLAVPAEVVGLAHSLRSSAALHKILREDRVPASLPLVGDWTKEGGDQELAVLASLAALAALIERALAAPEERGATIRPGFSQELDDLRAALSGGRKFLGELEEREKKRTGIRSLKVGYNKVFGYYIEISKPNLRLAPPDYIRKQTLTHAERFFTLELKEHEALIANARASIDDLETRLYHKLCDDLGENHQALGRLAAGLAHLDLYVALAECAARFGYVRPDLQEDGPLFIAAGRHPIVEQLLPAGSFVPNDSRLGQDRPAAKDRAMIPDMAAAPVPAMHDDSGCPQIMLLTAPNMAGKSVYLRQVALICLLAQAGSFVPAAAARVPLIDSIFTRIGLSDGTAQGHSSFMAEMVETAHILHHASPRSLVLLDEIGRGTSVGDGLAIARAVLEYLHNHPRVRAKTLFATHYHELTACAAYLPRLRNFHLTVQENDHDGKITYLHKVAAGAAAKSFGLHVARLAGLPRPVLHRARELLEEYESSPGVRQRDQVGHGPTPHNVKTLNVAGANADWLSELLGLDINDLSPVEALTRLYEVQRRAREALPKA